MGDVVNMQDIKKGKVQGVKWVEEATKQDGTTYPLKVWQNLECILDKHKIKLKYNEISKIIETDPPRESGKRSTLLTDVYTLNVLEGLNLSREETYNGMERIAEKNRYNPFIDIVREHENDDYSIINELFSCIEINDTKNHDYYYTLFVKWCINVVKMAHNTLANKYRVAGVLVLQGEQGCRKTTFVEKLMPGSDLCKCDNTLNTENTDSLIQNTTYILVEWGELEGTVKGDQAKLKKHITSSSDEYRSPYGRCAEEHPRLTSYVGTVNKRDFLIDPTGSRRFWIIPVKGFDFDKLDSIDKNKLWGAVYSLWKSGTIKDYLEDDERKKLNQINMEYNFQNDISFLVEEQIRWNMDESLWTVYGITEIANYLMTKDNKKVKIELERRGLQYKPHRLANGKLKKGFKIPPFETRFNL